MRGRRPILVSSDGELAAGVRAVVGERVCRLVCCTFDDCRPLIPWHAEAMLVLAATCPEDWRYVAELVAECRLRQSPLSVVILQTCDPPPDTAADCHSPPVAGRHSWPAETDGLVARLRASADADAGKGRPAGLARRLTALTPSLEWLADGLARTAASDMPVLLTGEPGTGKAYLARLIHEHSPRRRQPFLVVPCGGEQGGGRAGAYAPGGAGVVDVPQFRAGKFAAAGKGTVLLTDVDRLGWEQQAALVGVLEAGEYQLAGTSRPFRTRARVITTAVEGLDGAVAAGKVRSDLFYRLTVTAFTLPPLRERRADIPTLARAFVAHFNTKFRRRLTAVSARALATLSSYPWPGNIRQLESVLQQAVLFARGPELTPDDLPADVRDFALS